MNDTSIQLDSTQTIPYLDQWLGTWFIEPERGRALHSAISRLNIGLHLEAQASAGASHVPHRVVKREVDALAQNPDGQPVAIDWEQTPRSRGAYGYRIIDGVAILELNGSLMKHEASATESTSTVMMRRSVRKLMTDSQVKAVIFQIDSPGGTVSGIYELATDIAALAKIKPVHAHAANLVASAAYLLASQMRSISATASTLVGSLGTFGVVYDLSEMAAKEGVKVHLLKGRINGKESLMKGAGTPGTPISDAQLQRMQEGVDDLNQQFYDAVQAGPRKPKASAVEAWFLDAGVWVAAKSKEMGLIDRVESFDDMLARVSGEAKNSTRDTTASTTNKPSPDDGAKTGRRSDASHSIEIASGDRKMVFSAPSAEEAMQLHAAFTQQRATETTESNRSEPIASNEPTAEAAAGDVPPSEGADAKSDGDESPTKGAEMSQQTQKAPEAAATEPKPATIAELKAAFSDDPSFALEAAEKAYTLTEAKAAYADKLMAENKQLKAQQAEQAKQPPAPAAAPARATGVQPVASGAAELRGKTPASAAAIGEEGATAEFEARVEQRMKSRNEARHVAAQQVLASDEDLRQRYNAEQADLRKERIADRRANAVAGR